MRRAMGWKLVWNLSAFIILTTAGSARPAAQSVQIKPRILILVDTSGSMTYDMEGLSTGGDGSEDPWNAEGTAQCCEGNGGSRLQIAKNAITQMIWASGDVEFALMKFAQKYDTDYDYRTGYRSNHYRDNQVIGEFDFLRYSGLGVDEEQSSFSDAFSDRRNWLCEPFAEGNEPEILAWLDGHEFSSTNYGYPDTSPYPGPWEDTAPDGSYIEQELRADGPTPLAWSVFSAYGYLREIISADPYANCRNYALLVLADGINGDNLTPSNEVANLKQLGLREPDIDDSVEVDTWVVGLAYAESELDAMAAAGGGHFDPTQEGEKAYRADDLETLSSILYQVISGSVMVEECDGLDNDCDDLIDEGVKNRCGECGPEPEEVCDGVDNDCDGIADNNLTDVPSDLTCSHAPAGHPGNEGICEVGLWECQGGGWVCAGGIAPTEEVCDGVDNDCDGEIDEGVSYAAEMGRDTDACSPSPYAGVGECNMGVYSCQSGGWVCSDYGEPKSEGTVCDGVDNDCDGDADEGIFEACGGGLAGHENDGICRVGARYCDTALSMPGSPVWLSCAGNVDPQLERCNGLDDDCDGYVDNGLTTEVHDWLGGDCGGGPSGYENEGVCRVGQWVCKDGWKTCCVGGAAACEPAVRPSSELDAGCDRLDNDCDGEIDEGIREVCWVGQDEGLPNHGDAGQCVLGWRVCREDAAGFDVCEGAVGPSEEICDGVDNDCDGRTDEDLGNLGTCGGAPVGDPNTGECTAGALKCEGGRLVCSGTEQGPVAETCDGLDNDCDGEVDEGLYRECWTQDYDAIGICRAGLQACSGGEWGACEGEITRKDHELCNGLDDDCDGQTDEDPKGQVGEICNGCGDVWQCLPTGELYCEEANSEPEQCDGVDNDCDGLTDEITQPCGGAPTGDPDEGACRQGVHYCNSELSAPGNPVWFGECVGSVGPSAEQCDGVDNDCDGLTDEEEDLELVGRPCGTAIGLCESGTLRCVVAASGVGKAMECCEGVDEQGRCVAPTGPQAEVCNGYDDDCDSLIDEAVTQPCGGCDASVLGEDRCPAGPDAGRCELGVRLCVSQPGSGAALWSVCQGDVGPIPEQCNLVDDDCDGVVDEDVAFDPPECSRSATDDPNEGRCEPGTWVCRDGTAVCEGGRAPELESCNGLDDDCDGDVDEDILGEGDVCGSSVGVCRSGLLQCQCEGDACEMVCVGEVEGASEECNCLDDDCDGRIDEDIPLGATCNNAPSGEPTGECREGNLQCVDCEWVCSAGEPVGEMCNGLDDDCDGAVDEDLSVECPDGSICIRGECAPPCAGTEQSCPPGKSCVGVEVEGESRRVCVSDLCSAGSENQLECVSNPYFCTDSDESPPCVCDPVRAECVDPCRLKTCPEGKICRGQVVDGEAVAACYEPTGDCYTDGCPVGERCVGGACEEDPCAEVSCADDAYCNGKGECVSTCADMECPCVEGRCVEDLCAGVVCPPGLTCDPSDGLCQQGGCWGRSCKFYEICVENEAGEGVCIEDPCWNIDCPTGLMCVDGSCYPYGMGDVDTDPDDQETDTDSESERDDSDEGSAGGADTADEPAQKERVEAVLATGTGGCLCSTGVGAPGGRAASGWLAMLAAAVFLVRRRVGLLGIALVVLAAGSIGCEVEPFRYDSGASSDKGTQDASDDSSGGSDSASAGTDADSASDTGPLCRPDEPDDDCDGVDDDCDGEVDEDVDLQTNPRHCGSCGNDCTQKYPHAFGTCEDGRCVMSECATFWYDNNRAPGDGCEYFCQPSVDPEDNADLCDGVDLSGAGDPYEGRDNDCDGVVDEDVDFLSDLQNCGRCGNACRFPNASGACEGGVCVMGDCDPSYHDLDGEGANGCEYRCVPREGGEQCNGLDDDCDGVVDEDDGDLTSPWGAGGGGACYTADDGGCRGDPPECTGECSPGTWKCEAGRLRCKEMGRPAPWELCDNKDNDCDGAVDEEEDIPLVGPNGALCGSSSGECEQGRTRCAKVDAGAQEREELCCKDVDGSGVCVPPSAPEAVESLCDGKDNDCDGLIDEDPSDPDRKLSAGACYFGQGWGQDPPVNTGRCASGAGEWRCYWGQWLCEGAPGPVAESCNGVDDDCDGQIDEGLYRDCQTEGYEAVGICRFGLSRCEGGDWGECVGEQKPQGERCDGLDNDCDGESDEAADVAAYDSRIGQACGVGVCGGVQACEGGEIICEGAQAADREIPCNGVDDDCDGSMDEWDSFVCGGCDGSGTVNGECALGPDAGRCQQGTWTCETGTAVCRGAIGPEEETCDGLDNDCDGLTDESPGDPDSPLTGGPCGACGDGTVTCTGGAMLCLDATIPSAELCDGVNNDCNDGTPDGSGESWFGRPCDGPDADACSEGLYRCEETSKGVFEQVCSDLTGDSVEVCNGVDDDCDGETDEGLVPTSAVCNPGCAGTNLEFCTELGWTCDYQCTDEGGVVECDASGNPVPEETLCDGLDNDCDGLTDELYNFDYDVSNCGGCGNDCAANDDLWLGAGGVVPVHAEIGCFSGSCAIISCETGWRDDKTNDYPDCSYNCALTDGGGGLGVEVCDGKDNDCDGQTDENATEEVCDGQDNDCDGLTDEDLSLPKGACRTAGVCAEVTTLTKCEGGAWECNYDALTAGVYQAEETLCDGLDNDCDGVTDEGYASYSTACSEGIGQCRRAGINRCNDAGDEVVCCDPAVAGPTCPDGDIVAAGEASEELCDGVDNDCDGLVDEGAADSVGSNVSYITVSGDGFAYDIFTYEASRPDAEIYDPVETASNDPGVISSAACSSAGKVPWTMVGMSEARGACFGLNPSGEAEEGGWDLCTKEQWRYACELGGASATQYPYGNLYEPSTCNGADYSSQWNALIGTGDAESCVAPWDSDVFDMSGNAEEWTRSSRRVGDDDLYEIRGGSFNDQAGGLTCDFDFWAAESSFRMPNLGFRCCRTRTGSCELTTKQFGFDFTSNTGECASDGWSFTGLWGSDSWNGRCVVATNPDGTYLEDRSSEAKSPVFDLTPCGGETKTLHFTVAYALQSTDTQYCDPPTTCDKDWADFQVFDGADWVTIAPSAGYTAANRWCCSSGGAWPASPAWISYDADVTPYLNEHFQVRFRLQSDGTVRDYGLYVSQVYLD